MEGKMRPNIKTALENYFLKLESLYFSTFGTKPTVPYSDSIEKSLLIGDPDGDGEIQWLPKVQTKTQNLDNCEERLGFVLCKELKEYYSTFYFLAVSGVFGSCKLHFYRIDGSEPIDDIALRDYNDAQYVFLITEIFLLGNAIVNDDDSYFVYYDNATGRLFCYESYTKKEILLSYSIAKTIGSMAASL